MTDQELNVNSETITKTDKTLPQRIWDRFTSPSSDLTDIGDQRSARLAASFLFVISILIIFPIAIRTFRSGLREGIAGGLGITFAATLVAYLLARTRRYRIAIFLFSIIYSATAYAALITQGAQADVSLLLFIYVPVSLIVASTFLPTWTVFLLALLNIGAFYATRFLGAPVSDNFVVLVGNIIVAGIVLIILTNFRNNIEKIRLSEIRDTNRELKALSNELENRVEARTQELVVANQQTTRRFEQLSVIAELARSLTDIQDLDSLLPAISTLVSQRLGYYHVGIFLNDDNRVYAVLRAANSEGGQTMLARGHKLRIGEEGIVGYAIKTGKPRIALDVGTDSVYFDNPDLQETRSEMALPLRVGSEYIGALDIQSTEANAFSTEDMPVFTTLADQIAIAIQNARLLGQSQRALREVEEAYGEQTGRAWKSFSRAQPYSGYHYDGREPKPIPTNGNSKFEAGLTLPMRLRGQTIGKLKLKTTNKNRTWSNEEISLVEATVERAALALETARLLEDAQRRASREQIIGEISDSVGSSTDMTEILRSAVQELGRKMGGAEVVLELGADIEENVEHKGLVQQ